MQLMQVHWQRNPRENDSPIVSYYGGMVVLPSRFGIAAPEAPGTKRTSYPEPDTSELCLVDKAIKGNAYIAWPCAVPRIENIANATVIEGCLIVPAHENHRVEQVIRVEGGFQIFIRTYNPEP